MKYYEDIKEGEMEIFPGRYSLTEKSIMEMGKEWDPYPFHTDRDAAKASMYGGLVASTVHLFAISVKLGHTKTETLAAVGTLGLSDLKTHAPAYVGDTIENHCTYLEKRVSKSKPGLGIIKTKIELYNQNRKLLFSYIATALYKMKSIDRN